MSQVGIIGAGTMGAGIAYTAAITGNDILVHDTSRPALQRARSFVADELDRAVQKHILPNNEAAKALSRLKTTASLKSLQSCDIIIEAAVEDLAVKQQIFNEVDLLCKPSTLLASNTSSLSITSIASRCRYPQRVIGLHFFNPVPRMKLVEIIRGIHTSDEMHETALNFIKSINKVGITVQDTPGFVVNRVARPFYGEALRLLGEGVASVEEIDRIVKMEGNFKMGPFELMDLIGIDINFAVTKSVYEQTFHEARYRPHIIQQRMVESGKLGRKSKKGFYSYE